MQRRNEFLRGDTRGFTLLEAAVTLVAFGLIMVVAFQLFTRLGVVAIGNDQMARSQSGARVAMEEIERYLRSAGAEVDLANGQRVFVHADPFTVIFNANVQPAIDPLGNGQPAAINVGAANAGVPSDGAALYTPDMTYTTGAETIVFSIDSNLDGAVNAADKGDDLEEDSNNPNDYVLYRNIHGWDGNANVVDRAPLAVVRGPEANSAADYVPPMFGYWLDHDDDRTTPPQLFGDADGDGEISAAEAGALTPLDIRDLARIERVSVTVTSETATPNPHRNPHFGGYERVTMASEVTVRQMPRSTAVVFGTVFRDADGNGLQDPSETTLSNVMIRSSNGRQTQTGPQGRYMLSVPPGRIVITEVDPTGYNSSTTNDVTVDAFPGSYHRIDFGDVPSSGLASVYGKVFDDVNQNGLLDEGERGIANVKIYADTGEQTFTNSVGFYRLDMPIGIRTVAEVDSTGYLSTTPNSVEVDVSAPGSEAYLAFGDVMVEETGTIEGYVFEDQNRDGVRDNGEGGVAGAVILAGANSTQSDTQGFFSLTVPAGLHSVTEQDPPGFTSTTPNTLDNIQVDADQVVNVSFGDAVEENIDFDVIDLADTEKALSIASGDLGEDRKGDADLVLGTRFSGGSNNLLVWHNQRVNSTTPNAAIFASTPSFTRANAADVTSLVTRHLDSDRAVDLITGLSIVGTYDINVWMGNQGLLEYQPDYQYLSASGATVWDIAVADFDLDGDDDFAAAIEEDDGGGHVEIWWGRGNGRFERDDTDILRRSGLLGDFVFGPIRAVAAGDLNGDSYPDLAVASLDGPSRSSVHVLFRDATSSLTGWRTKQMFRVYGTINRLGLIDMVEDNQRDLDIVIATEHSETTGGIELWHQSSDGLFGLLGESGRSMNDFMPTAGAPLSLLLTNLDNDVFSDVVVGVRGGSGFDGTVQYAQAFGHLPSEPSSITDWSIGAVMTMTENDFNQDGVNDLAAGTQNSSVSGKVFIFFRR